MNMYRKTINNDYTNMKCESGGAHCAYGRCGVGVGTNGSQGPTVFPNPPSPPPMGTMGPTLSILELSVCRPLSRFTLLCF